MNKEINTKGKSISIRLNDEEEKELERLHNKTGYAKAQILKQVLHDGTIPGDNLSLAVCQEMNQHLMNALKKNPNEEVKKELMEICILLNS